MQQDKPVSRDDRESASPGSGDAAPKPMKPAERRAQKRRPVDRLVQVMRVCKIIFDTAGKESQTCSVLDASDNGYRVSLPSAPSVALGTRVIFEHIDGTRRYVRVCRIAGNELGLEIDWTYSRIILDAAEQDTHDCKFLGAASNIYRVEFAAPEKFSVGNVFVLESADGVRHEVRVRWIWENELGLLILKKLPARRK